MALYIKANRLVAEHLKVDNIRLRLNDGNYMLWQADMLPFGKLYEIPQICERIGAIPLQPWEARQEQDGTVCRQLPVATDVRFVMPVAAEPETDSETTDVAPESTDNETAGDDGESEVRDEL